MNYVQYNKRSVFSTPQPPSVILGGLWRNIQDKEEMMRNMVDVCMQDMDESESDIVQYLLENDDINILFDCDPWSHLLCLPADILGYMHKFLDLNDRRNWSMTGKVNNKYTWSYIKSWSYPQLNRHSIDSLIDIVGIQKVCGRFLFDRELIDWDYITDVIMPMAGKNTYEDLFDVSNPLSFNTMIPGNLFTIVAEYLTFKQLLNVASVNRGWHHEIYNENTLQNRKECQNMEFNHNTIEEWNFKRGNRWLKSDAKYVKFVCQLYMLEDVDFPKFDEKSIQVYEGNVNHLDGIPDSLKAMRIEPDLRYHWWNNERGYQWDVYDQQSQPLELLIIDEEHKRVIKDFPRTQKIVWTNGNVCYKEINNAIQNCEIHTIVLQDCQINTHALTLPADHKFELEGKISYDSNTDFICIGCNNIHELSITLWIYQVYDKYIKNFYLQLQWEKLDGKFLEFLSILGDAANTKHPKCIYIMFEYNGLTCPITYNQQQMLIEDSLFAWSTLNHARINKNTAIKHFIFGIENRENKESKSYCWDLKIADSHEKIVISQRRWFSCIYNDVNFKSSNIFNRICQHINKLV